MAICFSKIISNAEKDVQELKEKQFRILAWLLSVIGFFPIFISIYRVLASDVGSPYDLVSSTVTYVAILASLLPSRILPFNYRKSLLVFGGAASAFSPMVIMGTIGSGYIVLVLDAFIVHYFFEKKSANVLLAVLIVCAVTITGLRVFGVLPAPPSDILNQLHWYSIIKMMVAALTIIIFHVMYHRSASQLKESVLESVSAREKLRQEQMTTSEYLESIPGVFFLFNQKWELDRWNHNLEEVSGFSAEELAAKDILSFFEFDQQGRLRKTISDTFFKGTSYAEGDLVDKQGDKHPFSFTCKAIQVDGVDMACGIGIDLKEKKQLEKEVQEAQKMEALGTLAGGVAHDLNNILGGIIGYTEIIKWSVEENEVPQLAHANVVLDSCNRAAGIVKQILMFSRKTQEKKIALELRSAVRDALNLIRQTVPKSIEIDQNLPREEYTVMADVNQVHQVVMNICTNAWHAMRETGGTMSVSIQTVDVASHDISSRYDAIPGVFQKITIADTGTGIPRDLLETIFDPFFTTKPVGEGTGLGLAVVDKIIKSHDGFLTVESEEGKGTVFSLFFPVNNQNQLLQNDASRDSLPTGTEGILVVDDEPTIREASNIILTRLGYTVFIAENGEEGLAIFLDNQEKIQLVITDLSMPVMNGSYMAERMREVVPNMPILLCTGYSEAIEAKGLKVDHFTASIYKPLRKEKLSRVTRRLLDGETFEEHEFD